MPYQWQDPDLLLELEGVAIYYCYDDFDTRSWYWYTTDPSDCNFKSPITDAAQFDVRDLPNLGLNADDPENHAAIIQHAIQQGLIIGEPAAQSEPVNPADLLTTDRLGQPFIVASVCREDLQGILTAEEIARLSDGDMQEIAARIWDAHCSSGEFWNSLDVIAKSMMRKKESPAEWPVKRWRKL